MLWECPVKHLVALAPVLGLEILQALRAHGQ